MPRKNPVTEIDAAIGTRLTFLRCHERLSRDDLAIRAELSAGLIARVESGRMPLRYSDARALLRAISCPTKRWPDFRPVNPLWVMEGQEPKWVDWPLFMPPEHDLGLPFSATFSYVIQLHRDLISRLVQDPTTAHLPESWLRAYFLHSDFLRQLTARTQAEAAIVERLFKQSAQKLEPSSALAKKLLPLYEETPKLSPAVPRFWDAINISSPLLTTITPQSNNVSMQSEIPVMIQRIKKATAQRGKKAELARYMDVEPPRVSEWLSDRKEPSGETTLRLLHWVEQQEAHQKQSAGSVLAPPAPKTQSKASNEKKPKSSPSKR